MTFLEFMEACCGPKWVVCRRTQKQLARYGEETMFLTPRRFTALKEEFKLSTNSTYRPNRDR